MNDFTVVDTGKHKQLTDSDLKLIALRDMITNAECMCDDVPPGVIKPCTTCELRDEMKDLLGD